MGGNLLTGGAKDVATTPIWHVQRAAAGSSTLTTYLNQGWEPFATVFVSAPFKQTPTSTQTDVGIYIYLRKFGP